MKQRQSLTQSLIVVIVGSYVISQYVYPGLQESFVLYGPAVKSGEYWRLFTVALLHANWMHLIFNMLALWSIGTPVEQIFGKVQASGLRIVAQEGVEQLAQAGDQNQNRIIA